MELLGKLLNIQYSYCIQYYLKQPALNVLVYQNNLLNLYLTCVTQILNYNFHHYSSFQIPSLFIRNICFRSSLQHLVFIILLYIVSGETKALLLLLFTNIRTSCFIHGLVGSFNCFKLIRFEYSKQVQKDCLLIKHCIFTKNDWKLFDHLRMRFLIVKIFCYLTVKVCVNEDTP